MKITKNSMRNELDLAKEEQKEKMDSTFQGLLRDHDDPLQHSKAFELSSCVAYLAQGQGLRPYQEDRARIIELSELAKIKKPEDLLANAILDLGKTLSDRDYVGSTLVASIIKDNVITTANVGDSRALLVEISDNGKIKATRLTRTHKPKHKDEFLRIKEHGGFVDKFGYVQGQLAVSRALGDASLIRFGVSFEPGISSITIKKSSRSYLVLCTDGITDVLHEDDIAKCFESSPIETVAHTIRESAYRHGSMDNMTVNVIPINCNHTLSFVADGHGGDEVSSYVENHLPNIILNLIR